jgi:hypothetical protein
MTMVSLAMGQYSFYLKMGDTTSLHTSAIHTDSNIVPKGNNSMVILYAITKLRMSM